jgi:DNA repair protein SbcC/Rad50
MKIVIKKLSLTNFKGIKKMDIPFNHITDIFGQNTAGKTTIFDAFTWLFFDKDSSNRTTFSLKPIDAKGNVSKKVDVEVSAIVELDGKEVEIKKIHREKWVKKKGELTAEFGGNENLFYWNDVPLQLKQFSEKVKDIVDENIFKLITNPLHFNNLKWQDRRTVLLQLAGTITNADLAAGNKDFQKLIALLGDKTLEEYKREIAVKKKKLKDELQLIPTRIDEVNKQMPEAEDYELIRSIIQGKLLEINEIDEALQDAVKISQSAFEEKTKQQNEVYSLNTKAANLKAEVKQEFVNSHNERKANISELEIEVRTISRSADISKINIEETKVTIDSLKAEQNVLVEQWKKANAETLVFGENQFDCPACTRPLDADKINTSKQTLTENFNTDKANRIAAIVQKGNTVKEKIAVQNETLQKLNDQYTDLQNQLLTLHPQLENAKLNHNNITANAEAEFNAKLASNVEYLEILADIETLTDIVDTDVKTTDNSELKDKKASINFVIDSLKKRLTNEDRIKQSKDRIEVLEAEEIQYAQQLADLEGSEYLAELFTKSKMDLLVERINGRFKYVNFKMFNTLGNGGEEECCDTLVNGVPFIDANNAAKINAGLDIINTLCQHYNVYAPIFIDNRESVTTLIDCESQIVNLIVSAVDKKLRIA